MTTVARAVLDVLRGAGVTTVFGLPGVHNLSFWREAGPGAPELVVVRHEQTAVYAADGLARASGGLGAALTTTGPGAANTVAAVGEAAASGDLRKYAVVTCEVIAVKDGGLEVRLVDHDVETFIKRSDLSRDRDEQRPERFSVGQKVDARVISFDKKTRKLQVSIKALEIAEEKEAVAQYGSTDSGASLGDILGAALKKQGS
jgi:predicted RNA-binding protein with RPS1 domain